MFNLTRSIYYYILIYPTTKLYVKMEHKSAVNSLSRLPRIDIVNPPPHQTILGPRKMVRWKLSVTVSVTILPVFTLRKYARK